MIESNGSYKKGDNVLISATQTSVAMASETALVLEETYGIKPVIVMKPFTTDPKKLFMFMQKFLGEDSGKWDPNSLKELSANAYQLYNPMRKKGRGHLIVPFATEEDTPAEFVNAVDVYRTATLKGSSDLEEMAKDGKLISWDIVMSPTMSDVIDINQHLPKGEERWTIKTFEDMIYEAIAVPRSELKRYAFEERHDDIEILVYASKHGGWVRYRDEDDSDLKFRCYRRPILLDQGCPGMLSIGGTKNLTLQITNQPAGEIFVAPIETSTEGKMVFDAPLWTEYGTIQAPYYVYFHKGEVVTVLAEKESLAALMHITGQRHISGKQLSGYAKMAFERGKRHAEFALGALNPVLARELKKKRLLPTSKNPLLNEKVGDYHSATGNDGLFGGLTKDNFHGAAVEHHDCIRAGKGELKYLGN
jgi:hypothetical protein